MALPKHEDQYFVNVQIVHCLAGQYKFYEAREVANRVLAAVPEVYYERRLRDAVEAFDMMGEYHFADALLLEQAGIRKAAGKTLQPITSVHNSKRATYKSFVEFSNPTTAMELNRKGVLLALSQQCEKALPLFEKSAAIVDNPTTARFAMACLAEQKQYEQAWNVSNGLIEFNGNDVMALAYRGVLNAMQGKTENAETDFTKAFALFPELASFYGSFDTAKQMYQSQSKTQKVNEIAAFESKFAALGNEIAKAEERDSIGDILDEDDAEANAEFETMLMELIKDSMKTSSMSFSSYAKGKPVSDAEGTKYFNLKDETPFFDFLESIYLFYGYTAGKKRSVMIKFNLLYDEDAILQSIKAVSDELKNGGNDSKVVKRTVDNKIGYDLDISNSTRLRFIPESNTLLIFGL